MTASPFNGTAYNADTFSIFLNYVGGFVVPTYSYELGTIPSTNNGEVLVRPGMGVCYTTVYMNDDNTAVSIGSAVNNRIDRIVLRYDVVNTQTRITKITGVEAANPSPPALTAGDVPLAWVWIPAGYNAATTLVDDENIHDERVFRDVSTSTVYDSHKNLMPNSEFIAYSGAALGTDAPECWRIFNTPTSITGVVRLNSQPRGLGVRIQGDIADGMETDVRVPGGVIIENYVVIKGVINITSGAVRVTVGGTIIKDFYRTGVDQEFVILAQVFAINEINIVIEALANGSDFTVGQIMLFNGYIPGNFRPFHEVIMLDYPLADAAWSATAKSTGTTAIDLAASFGSLVSKYVRGLIVRVKGNDSASAANSCGMQLFHQGNTTFPISVLYLNRVTNDKEREIIGYVPVDRPTNNSFTIGVTATGVNTLDATVFIVGIIT